MLLCTGEPFLQGCCVPGQLHRPSYQPEDLQDHVKVASLPTKIIFNIQPMDQDVTCCFKLKYLELMFAGLHMTVACDAELGVSEYWRTFNIMDCIQFTGKRWEATPQAYLN